jgi:hypothetical protein
LRNSASVVRRQTPRGLSLSFQIVEKPAEPGHVRNIVGPVVDRRQGVAIGRKCRAAESLQRQPALLLDELQRALALDVLEPQIWIVVGGGDRRPVVDGHGSSSMAALPRTRKRYERPVSDLRGGARPVQRAGLAWRAPVCVG